MTNIKDNHCFICKKIIWRKNKYCRDHYINKTKFQKREKHPNWKGGLIKTVQGYVRTHNPLHPNTDSRGYVTEHRLVMEKHIGRYLKKAEDVHHIDGNKINNHITNLMLLTHYEHGKMHAIRQWADPLWKGEKK